MKTGILLTTSLLCAVILLGFYPNINAQTQKGLDIDGETAGDQSGVSVSMPDANTVAIGAIRNDGSGTDAGQVRVYTWNGSAWVQKGIDIDGEAAGDYSGQSICMPDANTIAIGANGNAGNGTYAGHVRIYAWNGSSWVQKGLDIDGEAANDESGISVSMPDSNTVAIGAYANDGSDTDAGHVRIYSWDGSSWVQKGPDIDGEAAFDGFGRAVSMPDSNTVAIGAYDNDGNGMGAGHVRIYAWNGSAWVQKGFDIDGEAFNDASGRSVSMPDSNTVAIGAYGNDGNGTDAGHVRIFSWNGSTWVQKGLDIDGEAANDGAGWSVSMPDSNTVAIGARYNDGNGTDAGHVRIYDWNGTAWVQTGIDIDGEAAGDWSGWSVSMPDTSTVAIGARFNGGNGTDAGHVRIYFECTGTSDSISLTACNNYISPSGNYTWTTSGTYMDTISNTAGCDSVLTIILTINTTNIAVTNNSPTLTAQATGATYQWVDCSNGFVVINGATNQSYTATSNGSYAVIVTQNNCSDTSACEAVNNIGIQQNDFGNILAMYPNPTDGELTIDFGSSYSGMAVVRNELGQEVNRQAFVDTGKLQFTVPGEAGVYFIEISADEKRAVLMVIKK